MSPESRVPSPESNVSSLKRVHEQAATLDVLAVFESRSPYGFENLHAWNKARELRKEIAQATLGPEFGRDRSLEFQIKRAALSVMSNIAEGAESTTDKEFARYLSIAKASCAEVRSQLYSALDSECIDQAEFGRLMALAVETAKLVGGLLAHVRSRQVRTSRTLGTRDSGHGTKKDGTL